jgi:hypothetical protein
MEGDPAWPFNGEEEQTGADQGVTIDSGRMKGV